jgi:tRNA pseudouridine55 synthase
MLMKIGMSNKTALSGLLVVDKPLGMTSRDAVNRAWGWLPRGTRIGHTGTLDPLATGVLVLCVGAATRLAEYVQRMEKVYRASVRLGARSTTDDGEGTVSAVPDITPPELERVTRTLQEFLGTIEQVPPDHSAAKVTGRRAYALARQGREMSLAPRPVTVHALSILEYAYPRLDIEVRCGKGTYVRSLARDLGDRLGCGAYLESLRRTRVGHFLADEALSLDADKDSARRRLLPLAQAVRGLRSLTLAEDQAARLQAGQGVPVPPELEEDEEVAVVSSAGALLAVCTADKVRGLLLPKKTFGV